MFEAILNGERKPDRSAALVGLAIIGGLLILAGQLAEPPYAPIASRLRLLISLIGLALLTVSVLALLWPARAEFVMKVEAKKPIKANAEAKSKGTPKPEAAAKKGASGSAKSKGKSRPSKKSRKSPPIDQPNLELAALLLGSGLMLLIGRALKPSLPESQKIFSDLYMALGMILFVLTAVGFNRKQLPAIIITPLQFLADWLSVTKAQVVLLLLSPLMGLAAWLGAGDAALMRNSTLALASWMLGIVLVVVGSATNVRRWGKRPKFTLTILALGGLILVAFLLRGLATAQIPWLLTGDEGSAGLSAVEFIDGFRDNPFGVAWFSFPSLYFFVQSLFIRVFGQTVEALRIPSAIAGALTVLATYAFAREMFGRRVAWASAIFLAVFHFHIHFSRIGLMIIWDALFMAAFTVAFWRGWQKNSRWAFVAGGLTLALAQYFYVSIRVLLPLLVAWLVMAGIKDRIKLRSRLPGLVIMTLVMVVVVLPLALFFVQHPAEFRAPLDRVAALGPWIEAEAGITGTPVWQVVLNQFKNAALGYTSANLRLAYEPNQPMLLAIPATLFLMGLTLLLLRIRALQSIWMLLWIISAVFVAALSQTPPAAQRYVNVAPAVAVLVALPLITAADWLSDLWPARRRAIAAATNSAAGPGSLGRSPILFWGLHSRRIVWRHQH